MLEASTDDTFLADGGEGDGKRNHAAEGRPKVKVEVIGGTLAVTQAEVIVGVISIFDGALELEVAG